MRLSRWVNDLSFGARLAVSGGREGRFRTALAATGVGLGVALLLVCASIPSMLAQRHERGDGRDYVAFGGEELAAADNTLLVSLAPTVYRYRQIRGVLVRSEGVRAPAPPGLDTLPASGDLVVSPALADLLSSPDGALLRDRFPDRVVGTIGDPGLAGPNELAYYLGSDTLAVGQDGVVRIDHFGDFSAREGLDPVLMLLVVVIVVVLLLPIGTFVAAAVRFGGERRDRRLAAVRLVGADSAMARRIAAGEALLSAVLGLGVGLVVFLAGRQLMERLTLQNLSVFAADVRPSAVLGVLIAVAVPVAAVALTLLAMRRVIIEPLGVVRQTREIRRRLWWRLAIPLVGLVLLYPLLGGVSRSGSQFNQYQVGAGVTLMLVGTATLLPWLVAAVVRRLGGGGVSWQLAIRRLQLDSNTSVRAVTGIAVAAAGAIALQMLFSATDNTYRLSTGQDPARAQISAQLSLRGGQHDLDQVAGKLAATPGVTSVDTVAIGLITLPPDPGVDHAQRSWLTIGTCAQLSERATVDGCTDGDTFVFAPNPDDPMAAVPQAGQRVGIGAGPSDDPVAARSLPQWTIPGGTDTIVARQDPAGRLTAGIYLTPAAATAVSTAIQADLPLLTMSSYLGVDPAEPDVIERVRNVAATVDPTMVVEELRSRVTDPKFADIRRGLFIGAFATLLLIGASLLVTMVEQLRERRRLLAALVAFGTRRSTLSWSLLWQAAVPVSLGMVLAIGAGTGLGALLLRMVDADQSVRFDWQNIAGVTAAAAAVVLLVTVLSLPALWRLMRPDGLRTE